MVLDMVKRVGFEPTPPKGLVYNPVTKGNQSKRSRNMSVIPEFDRWNEKDLISHTELSLSLAQNGIRASMSEETTSAKVSPSLYLRLGTVKKAIDALCNNVSYSWGQRGAYGHLCGQIDAELTWAYVKSEAPKDLIKNGEAVNFLKGLYYCYRSFALLGRDGAKSTREFIANEYDEFEIIDIAKKDHAMFKLIKAMIEINVAEHEFVDGREVPSRYEVVLKGTLPWAVSKYISPALAIVLYSNVKWWSTGHHMAFTGYSEANINRSVVAAKLDKLGVLNTFNSDGGRALLHAAAHYAVPSSGLWPLMKLRSKLKPESDVDIDYKYCLIDEYGAYTTSVVAFGVQSATDAEKKGEEEMLSRFYRDHVEIIVAEDVALRTMNVGCGFQKTKFAEEICSFIRRRGLYLSVPPHILNKMAAFMEFAKEVNRDNFRFGKDVSFFRATGVSTMNPDFAEIFPYMGMAANCSKVLGGACRQKTWSSVKDSGFDDFEFAREISALKIAGQSKVSMAIMEQGQRQNLINASDAHVKFLVATKATQGEIETYKQNVGISDKRSDAPEEGVTTAETFKTPEQRPPTPRMPAPPVNVFHEDMDIGGGPSDTRRKRTAS